MVAERHLQKRKKNRAFVAIAALVLSFGIARVAQGSELDCTISCNLVSFSGALWSTSPQGATGSGSIDSFVRIGSNLDIKDGFNTGGSLNNQEVNGTFTHNLQLGDVPIIYINKPGSTGYYYEFFLDINQNNSDPLLALNNVQICLDDAQNLTGTTNTCPSGPADYTMGSWYGASQPVGTGNYLLTGNNINGGSGNGDLYMYVPVSTLGTDLSDYVYLFSEFGAISGYENNGGYEEWAVRICGETYGKDKTTLICSDPTTPEPGSMILLGTGLAGLAALASRRRRKSLR